MPSLKQDPAEEAGSFVWSHAGEGLTWQDPAETGPAFKPGNAAASRMIQRMHLPLEAKEHMPPKGKPQLTVDEATLPEWWIDAGAPADQRVADLAPPPLIMEMVAAQLGIPPVPPPDRSAMLAAAETIERKPGIIVRPLSADTPWLAANARLQLDNFGDAQLTEERERLLPIDEIVRNIALKPALRALCALL